VGFWLGESLGRVGQYDRAATELERFVTGGPHPLLDAGRLRLGWWSLAARRAKQSADAFRAYRTPSSPSAAPRTGTERDWAEAGLALALLNSDFDAAREAARGLESRRSPLREPLFLRFARTLVERKKGAEAQVFIQELLVANLTPAVRAWVLLLSGEASRAQGDLDDARTQYDLGRRADPATATGWLAGLRHAQVNFEMREFAQAARDLSGLVATAPSAEARALVLVLQAEAGYHAGQYAAAGAAFRRALVEFPSHPQAGAARLGVAWTALRQDRDDEARREFLEFVRLRPQDPQAPGAALLAAGLPSDAEKAFAQAQREGLGALASLGLAAAQFAQGKLDVAKGLFEDARDKGTPPIAHAAEYGLAAIAFQGGAHKDFKQPALAALGAAPKGRGAPRLLYVLAGIAVEEKDWTGALEFSKRLADEFPADEAADDVFESVGAGAVPVGAWPVVYEAYSELRRRYPQSPFAEAARLTLADAQVETGRAGVARQELEKLVASAPADAKLTRAWLLLARTRGLTGDRTGALQAYARAALDGHVPEWGKTAIFSYARLLAEDTRWGEARAILTDFLRRADGADAADAAYALGETYQGEGDFPAAAEYFMTAAYVAPESAAGRRALLGAAASLVAAKQPDSAAIVYKKLLDQPQVPADLAAAARKGLAGIRR